MDRCVGAVDVLLIRIHNPRVKEHPAPPRLYSGREKGFGLNLQAICDGRYIFVAGCISRPGSTNDRTAWNMSNFKSKVGLGLGLGLVVLPTHPRTCLLTPFPGTCLYPDEDAFN
ncbi:unnamed protein product [Discosporangium mesarthrocarpum]